MEKTYRIIKTVLFSVFGILIFIFGKVFINNECKYLPFLVGGIMAYYGVEEILIAIIKRTVKKEPLKILNGGITLLLGIIVLTRTGKMESSLSIVGVLWAVWAIMREGEEIIEKVIETFDVKSIAILNLLESIAVIVFSVMLILNPTEHHIYSHVILLGVELILEVTWIPLYYFIKKHKKA